MNAQLFFAALIACASVALMGAGVALIGIGWKLLEGLVG